MWKRWEHSAGVQKGGGSFEVMMKEFYFLRFDKKGRNKGVCVLPDFGSAGGHTEDYSKRQGLGKRERRVMILFSP